MKKNIQNETLKDTFLEFFKENPFTLLSNFSLIIGGLFFLIYFINIKYIPEVTVSSIFFIFVLSGIIGLIFILIILSIAIFPVISYQACDKLFFYENFIKRKYFKEENKVKFLDRIFYGKKLPKKDRYIPQFYLLVIPIIVFIIVSWIVIYLTFSTNSIIKNGWIGFFIIWLSVMIVSIYTFYRQFLYITKYFKKPFYKYSIFYIYLYRLHISLFFISISFFIFYPLISSSNFLQNGNYQEIFIPIYTIVFMLGFIVINVIERNFFKRIGLNFFLLISFLLILQQAPIIPNMIVKRLGLGQVKIDTLSLDSKGCKIISPSSKEGCLENNLKLVWRIGDNYVFDKYYENNSTKFDRYYIPKESVLSIKQMFSE